jgi:hypothetical protein
MWGRDNHLKNQLPVAVAADRAAPIPAAPVTKLSCLFEQGSDIDCTTPGAG